MAGKKISNGLVALSSAAVFAVYAAGYHRTSAAADRFAVQGERRAPAPITASFVAPAQALPSAESALAVPPAAATKVVASAPHPTRIAPVNTANTANATPAAEVPPIEAVTPPSVPLTVMPVVAPINEPPAAIEPPPAAPPAVQQGLYKDGTYTGWGSCRHGDIQASVVIEGGRIASTAIAQCYTRYPCSWIAQAPGQVVSRQSTNVDYVSGATQSINAFKDAIFEALSQAK